MTISETRKGIIITVDEEDSKFAAYFSNAPGSFEQLYNVRALRGFDSADAAMRAGREFVDSHQWEFVERMDIFKIFVRHWWGGDWGFSVRCGGMHNVAAYDTRDTAIEAARKYARREIDRLEAE